MGKSGNISDMRKVVIDKYRIDPEQGCSMFLNMSKPGYVLKEINRTRTWVKLRFELIETSKVRPS